MGGGTGGRGERKEKTTTRKLSIHFDAQHSSVSVHCERFPEKRKKSEQNVLLLLFLLTLNYRSICFRIGPVSLLIKAQRR